MTIDANAIRADAANYLVACTIATEVPPRPEGTFTKPMIELAARAVAEVIRNRAADPHFPDSPVAVVLQHNQFSAVCREDYWRRAVAGNWFPAHVALCLQVWLETYYDLVAPGALYYYSPVSMQPPGSVPSWAGKLERVTTDKIDDNYFRFFK